MFRYYYTDALAAAWMQKHFGMQFLTAERDELFCEGSEVLCLIPRDGVHGYGLTKVYSGKIYIRDAGVLKPQIGDVVYACPVDTGEGAYWRYMTWYDYNELCADYWVVDRTIQRNEIPFHWPQEVLSVSHAKMV